ncbi:AAA family ATPase [Mycolicibacterium sp. P1-18]|uniref:MobF family relaxase n=1 Tax=Mycolicibacterium sp. P1-18 TaxID=2024615 RepID=UPI0011F2D534|nr:MobF family relaxase [Mycolicibacterium sp. P1-18]KAA0093584.1 AAA family ATPase [Mycolicibacterium sp. P1-18]
MLTISRLTRWSIGYYNETAAAATRASSDRQSANGGLGEYYSEFDSRVPTWLVTGDPATVAQVCGLDESALSGGVVDTDVAATWLNDGVAPSGRRGRAFGEKSVHGFDLTFAAPKSVSLLRVLTDPVAEKVFAAAHEHAIAEAMAYLHRHAGYTRVHNPVTGMKDLIRLPGLVGIAYQHETSRCGDPHLHTHVVVPNRQPRADGELVSVDSKSLYHEAKAAGMIYQATLRHRLHAERGFEWQEVDQHSGMSDIAGVTKADVTAWSRRSTRLREWARQNLVVVDGEPTAAQLAAAQKATRPVKPESLAFEDLKAVWRADARGLHLDRAAHHEARARRASQARIRAERTSVLAAGAHTGAADPAGAAVDPAQLAQMAAAVDKAVFTRADMVELLGAQLPVDAPGDPRASLEAMVEQVGIRLGAPRQRHHREGHEKFTVDAVIVEEHAVLEMADETDNLARLDLRAADVGDLSADQAKAIAAIATSAHLVQPMQAPAGAGKTHSLKALRAAAHRAGKQVLVFAPTGKAVDEALQEGAGDHGLTIAKALRLIEDRQLSVDRSTVVVVDEAGMVGTPELRRVLACAVEARAKVVLVGDAYQLSPVKSRGGMFEQLCADLPWSQRLSAVWRMRDTDERDASLALRSAHGNRLRHAVGWYRTQGRLHTGDPVTMAADALTAYQRAQAERRDALLVCDTWEMADALNRRIHDTRTVAGAPTVRGARGQRIGVGDVIMSRCNDATIAVRPGPNQSPSTTTDQVRNGNRWTVTAIDPSVNQITAHRVSDGARVVFDGDYLHEHVTLGYAATVHAAQGVTADASYAVLGTRTTRAMAYVAMTRGRDTNEVFVYQRLTGEADHQHTSPVVDPQMHIVRRGNAYSAAHHFRRILANDDRPRTMHDEADRILRQDLPPHVADVVARNVARRAHRSACWQEETRRARGFGLARERSVRAAEARAASTTARGDALEL